MIHFKTYKPQALFWLATVNLRCQMHVKLTARAKVESTEVNKLK